MVRAALFAFLVLGVAGCEFARTTVPYATSPDAASGDWAAARAACASEGRVPVQLYEWAVVRRQAAFRCVLPGETMSRGTIPEDR